MLKNAKRWCEAYRGSGSSCTCGSCGTFTFATGGTRGGCFRWELVHPEVSPYLMPFLCQNCGFFLGCSKKEGANIDTKKLSRSSSGKKKKKYIYIHYVYNMCVLKQCESDLLTSWVVFVSWLLLGTKWYPSLEKQAISNNRTDSVTCGEENPNDLGEMVEPVANQFKP